MTPFLDASVNTLELFQLIMYIYVDPAVVETGTGGADRVLARGADHRVTGGAGAAAEDATGLPAVAVSPAQI